MTVDYLIFGQGICGTFLSYYLLQQGCTVCVIDAVQIHSASRVASGVINPVTGRRIVKTWLIEELLPFTWQAYAGLEGLLKIPLIKQCNVLDFYATPQMKDAFEIRSAEMPHMLRKLASEEEWGPYFRYNYGIGEINPCWLADVQALLDGWRTHLQQEQLLFEEKFDWNACTITKSKVTYKHITAKKLLCCEGAAAIHNPYFHLLPFALNKGEALIAHIPGLPTTNIFKQGISIVPWKEKDLFWIGATYEWNYPNLHPTAAFRSRVEAQLSFWLKLPVTITGHVAAERPANVERRPFVGIHPCEPGVGILNGMGTKGCSLGPYFASQLAMHLVHGALLEPLANVQRFSRILSRGV